MAALLVMFNGDGCIVTIQWVSTSWLSNSIIHNSQQPSIMQKITAKTIPQSTIDRPTNRHQPIPSSSKNQEVSTKVSGNESSNSSNSSNMTHDNRHITHIIHMIHIIHPIPAKVHEPQLKKPGFLTAVLQGMAHLRKSSLEKMHFEHHVEHLLQNEEEALVNLVRLEKDSCCCCWSWRFH